MNTMIGEAWGGYKESISLIMAYSMYPYSWWSRSFVLVKKPASCTVYRVSIFIARWFRANRTCTWNLYWNDICLFIFLSYHFPCRLDRSFVFLPLSKTSRLSNYIKLQFWSVTWSLFNCHKTKMRQNHEGIFMKMKWTVRHAFPFFPIYVILSITCTVYHLSLSKQKIIISKSEVR